MALIKCKNCGEEISDKSTKCVHCGYATEHSITHICPECGKEFDNIVCKNCGYKPTSTAQSENKNYGMQRRFNMGPLLKSLLFTGGFIAFLSLCGLFDEPFIAIIISLILFISSYAAFTGRGDVFDELDDLQASINPDPYKRAMYRQMKKNNKK